MLYNKKNLEVGQFADSKSMRPELTAIKFESGKTIATDSFTLVEVSRVAIDGDFPVSPDGIVKTIDEKEFKPFMIGAEQIAKIKIPKSKTLPILENVAISNIGDDMVDFYTTDLECMDVKKLRKIEGEFPEYEELFPKEQPKATIRVNGDKLAKLVKFLHGFNEIEGIELSIYGDGKPIMATVKNASQSARGLLMSIKK